MSSVSCERSEHVAVHVWRDEMSMSGQANFRVKRPRVPKSAKIFACGAHRAPAAGRPDFHSKVQSRVPPHHTDPGASPL